MTTLEKKLLRQQAEAYAFIYDMRRTAVMGRDIKYVRLTEGIDSRIEKRQKEYPTLFKRYFNESLKKANTKRISDVTSETKVPNIDVKRKKATGRKEAPKKTQKKVESRRSIRRRSEAEITKEKPE